MFKLERLNDSFSQTREFQIIIEIFTLCVFFLLLSRKSKINNPQLEFQRFPNYRCDTV